MKLIRKEDAVTSVWSGGTTTQLAISPEGAVYADRDFQWRLSTAEVLDETSVFTPLPDYYRFLTTRRGALRLRHDDGEWYGIEPGEVTGFEGGSSTVSEGSVTDFNLMVRKGEAEGEMLTAVIPTGTEMSLVEMFGGAWGSGCETALYVSSGGPVSIRYAGEEYVLEEGSLLLSGADEPAAGIYISASADTFLICSQMKPAGVTGQRPASKLE